jgi:hypothetical protein
MRISNCKHRARFLIFSLLVISSPLAHAEGELVNCDFVSGPITELKETQTGRDVAVGIAECERSDGVDLTTLVYGALDKCGDATVCANDESIPKLKMVTAPVEGSTATSSPSDKGKGGTTR